MASEPDPLEELRRLEAEEAALRKRREELQARLSGSGAIGIGGATVAGAGGVAVRGNVYGNIYTGPPPKNSAEALAIYRRLVAQTCGQLPLRGVDVGASDPTAGQKPLGLANVYVDLDTKTQVELKPDEKKKQGRERSSMGERGTQPLGALVAAIANRRMVLLGDPGGGKSTFVNHLAVCLASHAAQPGANWLKHLPGWPQAEADALPIVVVLRDFVRGLPDKPGKAEPHHLWDFITSRLKAQNVAFAAALIHDDVLEKGTAIVLLDGLDEVPTPALRAFVRDAVTAFIRRYPANRFLVTCRVLSYQPPAKHGDPDLRLPNLPAFELAPFDREKIDRFIAAWYDELAGLGVVRGEGKAGLTQQLQSAVRRPDLWRLAPNPLLLTVMALVHTHKGRLPDARAMLYEETIDILLWRWEQVKAAGDAETPRLRQLLLEANRTEVDLKRVLWQLAYEAHAQSSDGDDQDKLADINELKLEKALAALKGGDRNWAGQIIEAMKLRAGLLLERAPEVFTFPHRTFQEYLAGAHLAAQGGFAREARQLAEQGAHWREAILMAVGRLAYLSGDTDKPLALVGELCPAQPGDDDASWRNAWLAGDVLLEMGASRSDSRLGRDSIERVRGRLVSLLVGEKLTPRERAAAGGTLGRLGDPRDLEELVAIPAGKFRMGSDKSVDSLASDDELPQHDVNVAAFKMGKYPVTVGLWKRFVETTGYACDPDSLGGVDNHPAHDVSWRDARACCEWLTQRWRAEKRIGPGDVVRLPTEAEWEKAARGGLPFASEGDRGGVSIWPWGNTFDPNRANVYATGIGGTSAVGCFPSGASSYGCLDLIGNVWEWTQSKYKDYPYRSDDGREDLAGGDSRVMRGGAFSTDEGRARCASRFGSLPDYRYDDLGFRVVVSAGSRT